MDPPRMPSTMRESPHATPSSNTSPSYTTPSHHSPRLGFMQPSTPYASVTLPPPSLDRSASPTRHHQKLPNGLASQYAYAPVPGPSSTIATMQESYFSSDGSVSASAISPSHPHTAPISAQKRAYRQRRKDPSCDACRERKVKCDATDMISCSECTSRGVKCQFTKDTNRRMSSIKLVQDLERQLSQAKHHIAQLHTLLHGAGAGGVAANIQAPVLTLPATTVAKDHRFVSAPIPNFDPVRKNLRECCRGVFKPPAPYRHTPRQLAYPFTDTPLPPKDVVDRLLSHYRNSVHIYSPHIYWPTFTQQVEELYRVGSFTGVPHIWVALFFAVLACGTLMEHSSSTPTQETEGAKYVNMAARSFSLFCDDITLDHVRLNILISIFLVEMNMWSAGSVWLAAAVHTAQDIGLHVERGTYPPFEAEMRRRVWWALYNWDRVVSLELGKPLQFNDEDCDVGEPLPVPDEFLQAHSTSPPPPQSQLQPNGLIAIIPVTRITASIIKLTKSKSITAATLATYDEHFKSIKMSYPDPYPVHSHAQLDPRLLTAACALEINRMFLYRHNLSPACKHADRLDALERCVSVAKDTAHYVSRSMQPHSASSSSGAFFPAHMGSWGARLRTMAPSYFCSHLWRCMLFLCFYGEYGAALTLMQASAAIGDLRASNLACGRNLAFFLSQLIERLRAGVPLQTDEAMLVYVSGDLQASPEVAWAWTDEDRSVDRERTSSSLSDTMIVDGISTGAGTTRQEYPHELTEHEARDWGGWDGIQRTLTQLLQESQTRPSLSPNETQAYQFKPLQYPSSAPPDYPQLPRPGMPPYLTPKSSNSMPPSISSTPSSAMTSGAPPPPPPSNRISIKDIM